MRGGGGEASAEAVRAHATGMGGTRARVDLLVGHSAHVLQAALAALAVQRVEDELDPPRLDCCQAARPDRFLDDLGRREAHLVRVQGSGSGSVSGSGSGSGSG